MVTTHSDCCHSCSRPWEGGRLAPDDGRHDIAPEARSSPPLTVARALREHCSIPFESFFLATHLGGGKFAYFCGPSPIAEEDIRKMFRRDKFLQFQNRASIRDGVSQGYEDDYDTDLCYSTRTTLPFEDHWPVEPSRRKRPRRQGAMRRELDDDAPPVLTSAKKTIVIKDHEAVLDFYERGFKCIQQTACKEIAKAFVKIIAPKKQATHPYTGGYATAPDWWPEGWGPGVKERVRHVEPDHQWKKERVHLLKHILRLIINPETRTPGIQRVGVITVAKLEVAAMDSLATWFADPNKPKNARKRPILKELFRVAKMEERYKRNEIDGTTQVFVTADDMVMNYCFDPDDEDDDEEESAVAAAMDAERGRTDSVTSTRQTAAAPAATMPMLPSLSPTGTAVHTLAAQFQATPFLNDLPARANPYGAPPAPMLPSDLTGPAADQFPYATADGATAAMQIHDILTGAHHHQHGSSRRSSASAAAALFTPTTPTTAEFSSPSPVAGMYHHHHQQHPHQASPWPQSPQTQAGTPSTTAAVSEASSSPLFAYAPAVSHHHPQQQHGLPHLHHGVSQHQQQHGQHGQHTQPGGVGGGLGLPTLPPLPMPHQQHQHHHQPQHQQVGNHHQYAAAAAAAGHYGFDAAAVFRAGNIQLSMQHQHQHQQHHGLPAGYHPLHHSAAAMGQGQGQQHKMEGER